MASSRVGGSTVVSSSDSSDEDEIRRIREAVVLDCRHSTTQNGTSASSITSPLRNGTRLPIHHGGCLNKKSLRPSKEETMGADNELNTTPEFRAFVGRKLSEIIDNMVEVTNGSSLPVAKADGHKLGGVRLFSNSANDVTVDLHPVKETRKKRMVESSSSDSSEDERLASAAVSRDFIFGAAPSLETADSTPVCKGLNPKVNKEKGISNEIVTDEDITKTGNTGTESDFTKKKKVKKKKREKTKSE